MPSLVNYSKNPVQWDNSQGHNSIILESLGPVQSALWGKGILYSWISPVGKGGTWAGAFDLLQDNSASYTVKGFEQVAIDLDPGFKAPCAGIISQMGEGYIIAPSIRLKLNGGQEIVLMFLSPNAGTQEVAVEKTTLSVPESEATVLISAENGEVQCQGTVSGSFKHAKIVLNRNPNLPVYRQGFNQTLCERGGPGEISITWKPTVRNFQELLLVFDPFHIRMDIQDYLRDHIRAFEDDTEFFEDFVVGDTGDVGYTISLILDRGLGRHSSDQVRLKLS